MMIGTYSKELDSEGRLELPAPYLPHFAHGGVVTRGIEQYVYLYPKNEWYALAEKLRSLPLLNPAGRTLQRLMFSGGTEVALEDNKITIPKELREYAKLDRVVIVAGMGKRVDLSNIEVWQSFLEGISKPSELAQVFQELPI